jgi:hypothetical protein
MMRSVAWSSISLAGQVADLTLTPESSFAKGRVRMRRQRVQGLVPAGSLRVSINPTIPPPRVGDQKGLTQAHVMTVQRNAAGSLRVSLNSISSIPQEWGPGG